MNLKIEMFNRVFWIFVIIVGYVFVPSEGGAVEPLPSWLDIPNDYDAICERIGPDSGAVILNSWKQVSYRGNGVVHRTLGQAIHIKAHSERGRAMVKVPLLGKSQQLKNFRAWLFYPSGEVEVFDRSDGYMAAKDLNSLYSERRVFVLDRTASVHSDDVVFAYEYKIVERTIFLQDRWQFQDDLPTLMSSMKIDVPSGWVVKSWESHDDLISNESNEDVYSWEARELYGIKQGELSRMPKEVSVIQLGVTVVPPAKSKDRRRFSTFETWGEVARYGLDAQLKHVGFSDLIEEKADELTLGSLSKWEMIRAIGNYVQSVNYVPVSVDLVKGGGYEPNDAEDVLSAHYGDCKDMTVLGIALLKSVGIEAFPVMANISDEDEVHKEWPSPYQFNHCVIAIPFVDELGLSGMVNDSIIGDVLIFDPTSKYTPIGSLPRYLHGKNVLLNHKKVESLTVLPVEKSGDSEEERDISVHLDIDGTIHGSILIESSGHAASYLRELCFGQSDRRLRMTMRNWIAVGAARTEIEGVKFEDDFENDRFLLEIRFLSLFYGQRVAGENRIVLKPIFLGRHRDQGILAGGANRPPAYISRAKTLQERIRYEWGEGLDVEILMKPLQVTSSFARYGFSILTENSRFIEFQREWSSDFEYVSPRRYTEVVAFYDEVSRIDRGAIVLKLK